MKKVLDKLKYNTLFGIVIGGIIFGTIGVSAALLYNSNQVSYIPSDNTWEVNDVEAALDDLFRIVNTYNNDPIILTRASWGELSSSITIQKTKKYKGILYYTTSNNGDTTARNIYVKRNNLIIFNQSYVSNYSPYLKSVSIDEIELNEGDTLQLSLSSEDSYSVELLILY